MEKNFIAMQDLIPRANDSGYKRILAVGDVHGCFKKLNSLWQKISVTDNDLVIFLGDYIEGGKENLKVLRWLMAHNQKENFIILRGNMDDMFLDSFAPNNPNIIYTGEFAAAQELNSASFEEPELVKQVYDFLTNLKNFYSIKIGGREYFFCHAGINPNKPLNEQNEETLIWGNNLFYRIYDGEAVIIVGHKSPRKVMKNHLPQFKELDTSQPARIPKKNILLLDTRAKDKNGFLSCVDILTGEFWQS